ncbi:Transposase [compost metagenome]
MSRVQHTHSTESKYKAVQMYREQGFGYKKVAKELGISEASIRRWVKFYEHEGLSGLEEKRGKSKGINKGRPRKNPLSPEEELIRLRAENEYLKKLWALQRGRSKL